MGVRAGVEMSVGEFVCEYAGEKVLLNMMLIVGNF